MKKITENTIFRIAAVLFLLFAFLAPVYAESQDTNLVPLSENESYTGDEKVTVTLSDLGSEESMHYAFLYGYQALLQERCNGAILTFDKDNNYVTGYLTPNAPDDFCTRLTASTLAVSEPVTSDTMMYMYAVIGDRSSQSILLDRDDKAYVAVIMFDSEDDMIITPMWYSEAETSIRKESVARGINTDEVYAYHLQNGFDKDTIVSLVANGNLTAADVVLDAIKLKNEEKASRSIFEKLGVDSNVVLQVVILGALAFGILFFLYLVARLFIKHKAPALPENTEDDEPDSSDTSEPEN